MLNFYNPWNDNKTCFSVFRGGGGGGGGVKMENFIKMGQE